LFYSLLNYEKSASPHDFSSGNNREHILTGKRLDLISIKIHVLVVSQIFCDVSLLWRSESNVTSQGEWPGLFLSDQNCIGSFGHWKRRPRVRWCGDILKNSGRILRQPLGSRRTNRMKPAPNALGGAAFIFLFAFMFSKGANEISFTAKLLPLQQRETCPQFGGVAFSAVTRYCIFVLDTDN
jgi:hypothetical protein